MANAKDQIKMIEAELQAIRDQIARLRAQEEVLVKLQKSMAGETVRRTRAPNVKPLVLDIMAEVGVAGATSAEVDEKVREQNPHVAKDTVGSVLSRLKSAGALVYDGDRYYEKRFAPRPNPFDREIRAVN